MGISSQNDHAIEKSSEISLKALCPFCLKSFLQIDRHKCKIAPKGFKFDKEICTPSFFHMLYENNPGYNSQFHHMDLETLDLNQYRNDFLYSLYVLKKDSNFSLNQSSKGDREANDYIKFVFDHLQESLDDEVFPNKEISSKKSYYYSKIQKICPFCQHQFIRLDQHKCDSGPPYLNLAKFKANDDVYIEMYKIVGGWDERGFLLANRIDFDLFQKLLLKIVEYLNDIPKSDVNENLIKDFIFQIRTSKQFDNNKTQKIDATGISQGNREKLINSTILQKNEDKTHHEKIPENDNEPIINEEIINSIKKHHEDVIFSTSFKRICPFCSSPLRIPSEHHCNQMPEEFIIPKIFNDVPEIFYDIYQKLGALNQYNKLDPYKLNYQEYKKEFLNIIYQYQGTIPKSLRNYVLEPSTPSGSSVLIKEKKISHQDRIKLQKKEEQQKFIHDHKSFAQICPFCFSKFSSLANHSCDRLPPEFHFHPILDEVLFFKDLYQNSDGLNKFGKIDEYRLNQRKYRNAFLRIYQKTLKHKNPHYLPSFDDFVDEPYIFNLKDILEAKKNQKKIVELTLEPQSSMKSIIPQICPYCYQIFDCLYNHKCANMPDSENFDIQLYNASFFEEIYREIGSLGSSATLNFYTFKRKEYTTLFNEKYKRFLNPEEFKKKSTTPISAVDDSQRLKKSSNSALQLPNRNQIYSHTTSHSKDQSEIIYILNHLRYDKLRFSEICPYCIRPFKSLQSHRCPEIPKEIEAPLEHINLKYKKNRHLFFLYLYYKLDVWRKSGRVDHNKLHPKKYQKLYFQLKDKLKFSKNAAEHIYEEAIVELERELIEKSRNSSKNRQKLQIEFDENEYKQSSKPIYKYKQICPWCFDILSILKDHRCSKSDANIEIFFKTTINDYDFFFESLYRDAGALNNQGKLDPYRLNHAQYKKLFLEKLDSLNSKGNKKKGKNYTNQEKSFGLSTIGFADESLDSMMEDFDVNFGDSDEDVDMLDLMNADFPDQGSPSIKKPPSHSQNPIVSQNGESLCFSCEQMIECPLGYDSNQMESCFECNFYQSIGSSHDDSQEEQLPICFSCKFMMNCPRGLDSNEMEQIFDCKYFDASQNQNISSENPTFTQEISLPNANIHSNELQIKASTRKSKKTNSSDSALLQDILKRREEDQALLETQKRKKEEEKQALIQSIMNKWQEEKGELKIYCKKCESLMVKIETSTKSFYRCGNYPLCTITGDPFYVQKAIENKVKSQRLHADTLILYQYDESKNTVYISEIYSEGKIFL